MKRAAAVLLFWVAPAFAQGHEPTAPSPDAASSAPLKPTAATPPDAASSAPLKPSATAADAERMAAPVSPKPTAAAAEGTPARTEAPVSPWSDANDIPAPGWARSVVPAHGDGEEPGDFQLFAGPSRESERRGVTAAGAALPFFGARRGSGCNGRWWLVGPLAWTCSDHGELSSVAPANVPFAAAADGLGVAYYFVRGDGADAYVSLDSAESGAADRELEGGWGVAVVDIRAAASGHGARWAHTTHGLWISMDDLVQARATTFHGAPVNQGRVDFAWVSADRGSIWTTPSSKGKAAGTRGRFERVAIHEESGDMVRVDDDAWMLARDLARPRVAAPPAEVMGPTERWIDVDLASQTLVAYEGPKPVYATLVSTGRGEPGSESATPPGVHRIWVKLRASSMDNVERDDASAHYSLEDVPYVQFFDRGVALHGTYWHGDFGRVRSHGCVNLAPIDAQWLFGFTEPKLPVGWVAAYPMAYDEGTVVRVH